MQTRIDHHVWRLLVAVILFFNLTSMTFSSIGVQAATPQLTEDVAVTLVIDSSGSMADSDPEKQSLQAANLFIDLLSGSDQIGVIRFSDTAQEILPMQPVAKAGKETLKKKLENQFPPAGATDYVSALQLASQQLQQAPMESEKIIIFLTDGFPEPMLAPGTTTYDKAAYTKQVQAQVAAIAQAGIPIYTVGFGQSDEALLQKIADDTKGKAFLLSSPAQVASAFFGVLTDTKQRLTMDVGGVDSTGMLKIPVPAYTSQVTALVLSDGTNLEVAVEGESAKDKGVFLDVKPGYALLTITNPERDSAEEVQLKVKTNGKLQVAAARDVLFQPHLLTPENGAQYSLGEPMEISVAFNEVLAEGMLVEARMTKNGIPDLQPYVLKEKEGIYSYTYPQLDEQGSYEVAVSVRNKDGEIAKRSAKFEVKNLPAIKSDSDWEGRSFKEGEEVLLSGYLEKQNMRMTSDQDLQIKQFQLILVDSQQRETSSILSDDPAQETGDLVKGDGLHTLKYRFPEVGRYTAHMQAEGIYKGESFVLKEKVGTFEVVGSGTVGFTAGADSGWIDDAGDARLTILTENQSQREEEIRISVPAEVGTVMESEISLLPGTQEIREVVVHLNEGVAPEALTLTFQALDSVTVVNTGNELSIPLELGKTSLLATARQFLERHHTLILLILAALLIFVLVGYLLFYLLVVRAERNFSPLAFAPLNDLENSQTLTVPKGKKSFQIGLGEGQAGDLFLPLSDSSMNGYIVTIEKHSVLRSARLRFLAGYLGLLPHQNHMEVNASALSPGYLKVNGSLVSTVQLDKNETFEAAGYRFTYATEAASEEKNLLEGKDAFWQS